MNIVDAISKESFRKNLPSFRAGDTVRVHCKIREGDKERVQIFEGVCIRYRRGNINATFTVRKQSYGVGVERIFPIHSPMIDKIEIVSAGKVRRSRLYYLRELRGKAARIEGRQWEGNAAKKKTIVNEEATEPVQETAAETADA